MSYSRSTGLGQSAATIGPGTVATSFEPNWMGLKILAVIAAVPGAAVGAWTRSPSKAALAAVGSVALFLAASPLIPFAESDRSTWFVNRRTSFTRAPWTAPPLDVAPRAIRRTGGSRMEGGPLPPECMGGGVVGGPPPPASCWTCPPGFVQPRDVAAYSGTPGLAPDWRCVRPLTPTAPVLGPAVT